MDSMFDHVMPRPDASPRWKSFLILGTTGAHALGLAAFVVVAFWKIDKLPVVDHSEIKLSMALDLPPPGGPPPGARLKVMKPATVPKIAPLVPVQPTPHVDTPPLAATDPAGPTGAGPIGGGGNNIGAPPDSTEIGTGKCPSPPCGDAEPEPEPPKPPVTKVAPVIVLPTVAAGLRTSGNEKIYPPDSVRVSMVHEGVDTLQGTIKLCVSETGVIDSLRVLKSTGYPSYDTELLRQMRSWQYRPYRVNGAPVPMCTVEVVIYRMKN
jgi:TonB family protein